MKSDQARPLERLIQAAADQMTVSDKLGWLVSEYATQGWQPPRNLYLGQVELQALVDTGGVVEAWRIDTNNKPGAPRFAAYLAACKTAWPCLIESRLNHD